MRRCVVLLTLGFSFIAPLAIPAASAGESGSVQADSSCKRRRAKKASSESKPKKNKDGKKPYGFEL